MPARADLSAGLDPADLAACRALLRGGSRTFFAASMLLPAAVRGPACALYAFCRLADDAVDGAAASAETIARLRDRLERAYAGRPLPLPADRAFAATVARFGIPQSLPEALIEGFEWDFAGRFYETATELSGYAARVAGSVGAMMAMVMGARSPDVVARACDLGMAMQLSNIARDVGEDARAGRLYLPLQWLREAGIDPQAWLARPAFSPELGGVIARLLVEADRLYRRSEAGIAGLPASCRPGIRAARFLYAEIGREVERRGCDSVSGRAVVSFSRKITVLAGSVGAAEPAGNAMAAPAEDGARFLLAAVSARVAAGGNLELAPAGSRWPPGGRVAWLVDLFERLEKQERLRRYPRPRGRLYRPRPERLGSALEGQPAL